MLAHERNLTEIDQDVVESALVELSHHPEDVCGPAGGVRVWFFVFGLWFLVLGVCGLRCGV